MLKFDFHPRQGGFSSAWTDCHRDYLIKNGTLDLRSKFVISVDLIAFSSTWNLRRAG